MNALNLKLKYLQDIQVQVNGCELLAAQKKLLRYQGIFKFKEGDKESALYYSILLQIGSYKLLQTLILPNLDSKILNRGNIDQETILKMIILARVLASQGSFERSLLILNKIKNPAKNIQNSNDGILLYKSIFYVYLFNGDSQNSLLALENYYSFIREDNEKSIFYYCSKIMVHIYDNNIELAKSDFKVLLPVVAKHGSKLKVNFTRLLQFAIRTMEGVLDEDGYAHAETVYQYTLGERHKLFIKSYQLQYLILLGDKNKILKHIEEIYYVNMIDGSMSLFLNRIIKNELRNEKYRNCIISNFRLKLNVLSKPFAINSCIEFTSEKMQTLEYFSIPLNNNQLDLLAGVVTTPEETCFLTELQRKCLYHLVVGGESGANWLMLSELMYEVDLNIDACFENVRKIVAKLRSMKMIITYKMGQYFFHNNFNSILFSDEFMPGDQLLYIQRCSGKIQLTADDISKLLGLKKSRTNEYLRSWVKQKRLEIIAWKGNQKIYQICPLISDSTFS
jgi:hypothetical protein